MPDPTRAPTAESAPRAARQLGLKPARRVLLGGSRPRQWGQSGLTKREAFASQIAASMAAGCMGMLADEASAYAQGHCNAVIVERAIVLTDRLLCALAAPRQEPDK